MRLTTRAGILATLSAALVLPASVRPVWAQAGESDWHTMANGDEVLALAVAPGSPEVLWAGTEGGGLVRWDLAGGTHQQFLFPDTPGMAGNTIRDIAFDAAGEPWLAIPGGGVSHGLPGGMRRFRAEEGLPATLDLTSIAVDGAGTVWVGTRSEGLARLPKGAERWEMVVADPGDPAAGPGADTVADLVVSPDGQRLYVAHGRSGGEDHPALSILDVATGAWSTVAASGPGSTVEGGPPTDQLMALAFDEAGTLWAGSWAKGVLAFDGQAWRQFDADDGVCGRNVWAIATAGAKDVWAACGEDLMTALERGAGVAHWDGTSWHTVSTEQGLPTNDVVALAAVGGRAFLGTNATSGPGRGVVPMTGEAPEPPLLTAPEAIPSNDLTALAFQPDGTAWLGTRGLGLLRYDGQTWQRFTRADTPGLAGDTVTALALAPDGKTLYIGTTKVVVSESAYVDGGLTVHDLAADTWRAIRAADGVLPDDEVASLAVDGAGRVWVGLGAVQGRAGGGANSQNGDGLAVWDPATDDWGYYTRASTSGGLPGDTVAGLVTRGDAVWAATSYGQDREGNRVGGGVGALAAGLWQGWTADAGGFKTFSEGKVGVTGDVRSVLVDGAGGVWAGTWDVEDTTALTSRWPQVDAVVNYRKPSAAAAPAGESAQWQAQVFPEAGWVNALAQDTVGAGRVWAGTTRGHTMEFSPSGAAWLDNGAGGAWVHEGESWTNVTPLNSGLAAAGITAMVVQPSTGQLWLATENGGISVFTSGAPVSAATACAGCPVPTVALEVAEGTPREEMGWTWLGAGVLVVLGLVAVWWLRGRRTAERTEDAEVSRQLGG